MLSEREKGTIHGIALAQFEHGANIANLWAEIRAEVLDAFNDDAARRRDERDQELADEE